MSLTARKALELILPVPANKFISGNFTNKVDCCCVQGHLCRLTSENPNDYSGENCSEWADWLEPKRGMTPNQKVVNDFRKKTKEFISEVHQLKYDDISDVNNTNSVNGYTQPEIKDRVVTFLNDMIVWEEKETVQE